uniref:Uncharacterized protein n=1 Tax=Caenorhabditis japonica TaxID=281687 RepID=A0A8R1EQL4_CAEJA
MISKTALETADFVLRDLTDSPFPFEGKLIVLGGGYRRSYLQHPVINGDANWTKFLQDVGDGAANDYEDRFTLPEGLPASEDLRGDTILAPWIF